MLSVSSRERGRQRAGRHFMTGSRGKEIIIIGVVIFLLRDFEFCAPRPPDAFCGLKFSSNATAACKPTRTRAGALTRDLIRSLRGWPPLNLRSIYVRRPGST